MNARQDVAVGEPGIALSALKKSYGENTVVDSINLTIQEGEFMTLLGPSGSGKTTTLNMIAGFTSTSSGDIAIHGTPVTRIPPHKRDIGMVFQSYALFPHRTITQNVEYPLRRRGVARQRRSELIEAVLEMVRLQDFGNRYPSELSGGQQQRAALARALVYKPRVLLMDEPLGALDRKLREWLQSEIKRIHREVGSTFVYVTHDQEEALSMSDRIAVFNEGRIEQVGSAQELYEKPATLFVGRFVGESTVLSGPANQVSPGEIIMQVHGTSVRAAGEISGTNASILIRPENLFLEKGTASLPSSKNSLSVTVADISYLGSSVRYIVRMKDGSEGIVRTGTRNSAFVVGEDVVMTWDVDTGVVFAGSEAADG